MVDISNSDQDSKPSIHSILEQAAKEVASDEIEIYDCGQTKVVGETHVRLTNGESSIDTEISTLVGEANVVFLEFDPQHTAVTETFSVASNAQSPMLIAKEAAIGESKPIGILDQLINPLVDRLQAEDFTMIEALEVFSLTTGCQLFIANSQHPGLNLDSILERLEVPVEERGQILDKMHASLMRFIRGEEGYGLFNLTSDYMHYDSHLRDKEYARVISQAKGNYPDLKYLSIVGKIHAKPVADILNGVVPDPKVEAIYTEQKARIQNYLKSLKTK